MENEKRLIDADAFWNRLNNTVYDLFDPESDFGYSPGIIKVVLDQTKTVDAVEVVWAPILGFEGLYKISNLGKVRNHKGEILKQGIKRTNCTCYKLVNLWKDGRYYKKYVHRLIAEAFIPNPDNLPMVNHKDEDCKRWHKDTFSCDFMKYGTHVYQPNWYEEDFCSYGERKDND